MDVSEANTLTPGFQCLIGQKFITKALNRLNLLFFFKIKYNVHLAIISYGSWLLLSFLSQLYFLIFVLHIVTATTYACFFTLFDWKKM